MCVEQTKGPRYSNKFMMKESIHGQINLGSSRPKFSIRAFNILRHTEYLQEGNIIHNICKYSFRSVECPLPTHTIFIDFHCLLRVVASIHLLFSSLASPAKHTHQPKYSTNRCNFSSCLMNYEIQLPEYGAEHSEQVPMWD